MNRYILRLILGLAVPLLLLGCAKDDDGSYQRIRILNNQSAYDVDIEVFYEGLAREQFLIASGDSATSVALCPEILDGYNECTPTLDWSADFLNPADSILITFDEKRVTTFCAVRHNCPDNGNDRSILQFSNYTRLVNNGDVFLTYTITNDDSDNLTSC